jgi:cupin fold WbuC family metalloprotein
MLSRLSRLAGFLMLELRGTYVRPHRHRIGEWELVSVLQGKFDLVIFTSDGVVKNRVALSSDGASVAEIPGGDWHSVVFHAPAAVVLEIKAGPYEPRLDKEFASWAPPEDDPAAAPFMTWLETAVPGERASAART